jgi:hypothetical protein
LTGRTGDFAVSVDNCPATYLLQDKVKGTEEEKTAAAKRFAEISHGENFRCSYAMPVPYKSSL